MNRARYASTRWHTVNRRRGASEDLGEWMGEWVAVATGISLVVPPSLPPTRLPQHPPRHPQSPSPILSLPRPPPLPPVQSRPPCHRLRVHRRRRPFRCGRRRRLSRSARARAGVGGTSIPTASHGGSRAAQRVLGGTSTSVRGAMRTGSTNKSRRVCSVWRTVAAGQAERV